MKVLFAVSNENTSQAIIKKYQTEYKEIISHKNVYYFNAILKELQRDKTYDRVVIDEDLEQYVNTDYEQMDRFLFDKLDSISDEASNIKGEDIPIILLCTDRRNKSEQILVKLFGIGIYNAIIGNDRSATEVCRLINRPRSKKEAKIYYKIDTDDVTYGKEDENDVSELEIQNILAHYKRIGNNEEKYVESFDSIAEQYNDAQLKVISKCLPLNVRAVLEEKSAKYQQINSYNNKISDSVRYEKKKATSGTSEILLQNDKTKKLNKPVVIPSAIDSSKKKKILIQKPQIEEKPQPVIKQEIIEENQNLLEDIELEELPEIKEIPLLEEIPDIKDIPLDEEVPEIEEISLQQDIPEIKIQEAVESVKRGRGRPKKVVEEKVIEQPKRKRGRPKKVVESNEEETILPGFESNEEETILPGFESNEEEATLPGFEQDEYKENNIISEFDLKHATTNTSVDYQKEENQYNELDINNLIKQNQKLVSFVGTGKNGTSFLVNNVAEILSMNGIDTAILDLTQNRNSYYIYTKNDEQLRNQSNYITNNLKVGITNGIIEHKNLTIYTSPIEGDENLQEVESIIETLLNNHTVVLMDCDFTTNMRYFKYAQEIYLVQSMDVLTIQPLTAFLRHLLDKEMFEPTKARVVLNKFEKTKLINEKLLIGGMSIYNDSAMTVRKELFNRDLVPSITIPFDYKSYLRYLEGLIICDISLKGYSKEFIQCLKKLAAMIYPTSTKQEKYSPPSVKNNNNGFSPRVNNTLNQMKQNY